MDATAGSLPEPWLETDGYLNPAVRRLRRSATIAINERCHELQQRGRQVIRLGLGQSPFPVPEPVVEELRRHAHQKAYLPVQGLTGLREAIVDYYDRTQGIEYQPEHVIVGPGTKELMFLLQFAYDADLVLPAPSWVSYAPQARLAGRRVQWLPTHIETGLGVTTDALERLCREDPARRRLMILNYPGNPTGSTYDANQLEAIAGVARRYGVLVLSDEIYGALQFDGEHVSIARYYPEGTIISNGLSKWCGAGGWRVGAFIFPEQLSWLVETLAAVASETYTSVSAPVQYAAIAAFRGGPEIDDYLDRCRRVLGALMTHVAQQLRETGAMLCEPRGAYYVFPTLHPSQAMRRGCQTSAALCSRALEDTGVAFLPGSDFGRPGAELSVRLAGVDFDGAAALQAVRELPADAAPDRDFLEAFCQPTIMGVERLCAWLGGG